MSSRTWTKWRAIINRATPQVRSPAVVGTLVLAMLGGLTILGLTRTQAPFTLPSMLAEDTSVSYAVWGLSQSSLLMVLPLGAFLVVLARSFIGLKAFGLFTPMLIALAFLQIGPIVGPLVLGASVGIGMIVAPSLLKLRMTRVGFLGVLISIVVFVLAAAQQYLDAELSVDAFPVVVTALVVERWWRQWEKDGPAEAAHIAFNTLVLALVVQFVMVSHFAIALIEISPLVLPTIAAFAIAVLGRYRGLRMTEIWRFAPIWLEGLRNGNDATDSSEQSPAKDLARAHGEPISNGPKSGPNPASQFIDRKPVATPAFAKGNANPQRHSGDQSAQQPDREIQSAQGYRTGARQGGSQSRPQRPRHSDIGHSSRYLQLWGSDEF